MTSRILFKIGSVFVVAGCLALSISSCSDFGMNVKPPKVSLNVVADTVTGIGCVLSNVLHQGEIVGFRVRVIDPMTGDSLKEGDIASVIIHLEDGQNLETTYGPHPGPNPTDSYWRVGWEIPLNYPTGTLRYTVEAKAKDGRVGSYTPFNVSSSLLQIKDYDPAFAAPKTVTIDRNGFSPTIVTVSVGASVTWTNNDSVSHDIIGDGFGIDKLVPGSSYSFTFTKSGVFSYRCSIHTNETETIMVNAK